MGSGEFAIPVFQKAMELDFLEVVGIVTQPDKPFGRKQELKGSPVFEALKSSSDITWFKPHKFKDEYQEILNQTQPALIIVASYGKILPKEFIDYPEYKTLNLHGSILPELRGAVPVQMAILKGLKETGVTLQIMTEGMDEGDIIGIRKSEITSEDTSESLMQKLSRLSVEMLNSELRDYLDGRITPTSQEHSKATYCQRSDLERDKAEITFETDYLLADKMVRAFYPDPIAWIKLENGKVLRIFKSNPSPQKYSNDKLIIREGKKLILDLQNGSLELLEVQLEGKERRSAIDYLFLTN